MRSIPIPKDQKVFSLKGGYIKNACFIPTEKDWMLETTNYDPRDGLVFGIGEVSEEIKTFYMNEKGEWIDIN